MSVTVRKRPIVISIFAVIGFILAAGQIVTISAPSIRNVAGWYPIVYGTITALRFISIVGVWHMKKWGAELFFYVAVFKITTQVAIGDVGIGTSIDSFLSLLSGILFMIFYKRMDRNL